VLLLVAMVIFALTNPPLDVDNKIANGIGGLVDKISKGDNPKP
jgi:hypothetical protein